ncbi:MAG: DinB family protein, partial [Chloroflexi bacterium]|nr:DinB family protein [Chloroflexota bacterium]
MEFEIESALEILSRTPKILDVWLANLSDQWVMSNEGEETWSAFDIMGHFIHGEQTDWIPRVRLILTGEGAVPEFEPFDRFAQFEVSKGKTLAELLAAFSELRAQNLETLQGFNIQPIQFEQQGKHPELGIVNLKQLL